MHDPFAIVIWRDSVCAGDDGDAPHELVCSVPRDVSLRELAEDCLARRYLASINGGRATWILEAARPLAVIAQQWPTPRFLVAPNSPISSLIDPASKPHLNFRYCRQVEPDQAFAQLLRGEPFFAS